MIVDQIADGLNFHTGVTRLARCGTTSSATPATTGWPCGRRGTANAGNTFDHNTVQSPVLANGIAIYGGADNTVVEQPGRRPGPRGQRIQVGSRFGAEPFTGHLRITGNTTVRAGTYELNWNIGLGAIWFYALDRSIDADIEVIGDPYLDNTYNAIMLVSDWPVKDLYRSTTCTSRTSGSTAPGRRWSAPAAAGGASFENVDARNVGAVGVNNCGSFHFTPAGPSSP